MQTQTHQIYPPNYSGWATKQESDLYTVHSHVAGEISVNRHRPNTFEAVAFRGGEIIDLRYFDSLTEAKAAVIEAAAS